ncbi:hypothetical protein [Tranquillimonas alkanivorans]|uniref:EF-hand domain-containing protein n=1 Tax=Tranquillimonas alkanivorans TaxID=441119 RepID=A0A1I5N614_9RHOB|nr:hypothetical protein [Tranquillimonas alkanivorans]SFP17160.1 hypothetical protein SAMN04488047_103112 [Tranquillimonas alkanivorans]
MLTRITTTSALALLLAAPAGLAQDDLTPDLSMYDVDEDGFLDADEYGVGFDESGTFDDWDMDDDARLSITELSDATYGMMDLDNDGTLTISEWDTWVDTRVGEETVDLSPAVWDPDGNDIISREEFSAAMGGNYNMFSGYDIDSDGYYDENEIGDLTYDYADWNNDDLIDDDEFLLDDFGI